MRIVKHLVGHYKDQDVEFGKVYIWCPEGVVAECECGKRVTYERPDIINGSEIACECGEDHTSNIREELDVQLLDEEQEDKRLHPWRYWSTSKDSGLPF